MNAARFQGHEFRPIETRLAEYEARARRAAELDRREAHLLEAWARMGSAEVHSPYMGRVTWDFGPGGLSVAHNADELGE